MSTSPLGPLSGISATAFGSIDIGAQISPELQALSRLPAFSAFLQHAQIQDDDFDFQVTGSAEILLGKTTSRTFVDIKKYTSNALEIAHINRIAQSMLSKAAPSSGSVFSSPPSIRSPSFDRAAAATLENQSTSIAALIGQLKDLQNQLASQSANFLAKEGALLTQLSDEKIGRLSDKSGYESQIASLQGQINTLQSQLDTANKTATAAEAKFATAQAERDEARSKLESQGHTLREAQESLANSKAQVASLTQQIADLTASLQEAQKVGSKAKEQVNTLKKELAATAKSLEEQETAYTLLKDKEAETKGALRTEKNSVEMLTENLNRITEQQKREKSRLTQDIEELTESLNQAKQSYERDLAGKEKRIGDLSGELKRTKKDLESLEQETSETLQKQKKEIAALSDKKRKLQNEKLDLEGKVEELERSNKWKTTHLREELESLQAELDTSKRAAGKELQEAKERANKLETQIEKVQSNLEKTVERFNQEAGVSNEKFLAAEKQRKQAQSELKSLSADLELEREKVQRLTTKTTELQQDIEKAEAKISQLQKEHTSALATEKEKFQALSQKLDQQAQAFQTKEDSFQKQTQALSAQFREKQRALLDQKQQIEVKLEDAEKLLRNTKSEKEGLNDEVQQLSQELEKAKQLLVQTRQNSAKEIVSLTAAKKDAETKISSLEQTLAKAQAETCKAEETRASLEKTLKQKSRQLEEAELQGKQNQRQIDSLRADLSSLSEEKTAHERDLRDLQNLLTKARGELSTSEQKLEKAEEHSEEIKKKLTKAAASATAHETEKTALQKELDSLKGRLVELNRSVDEKEIALVNAQKKSTNLSQQNLKLEREKEDLQTTHLPNLQKQIAQLREELSAEKIRHRAREEFLQQEYQQGLQSGKASPLDHSAQQIATLQQQVDALQKKNAELTFLEKQKTQFESTTSSLQQKIAQLQGELEAAQKTNTSLTARLASPPPSSSPASLEGRASPPATEELSQRLSVLQRSLANYPQVFNKENLGKLGDLLQSDSLDRKRLQPVLEDLAEKSDEFLSDHGDNSVETLNKEMHLLLREFSSSPVAARTAEAAHNLLLQEPRSPSSLSNSSVLPLAAQVSQVAKQVTTSFISQQLSSALKALTHKDQPALREKLLPSDQSMFDKLITDASFNPEPQQLISFLENLAETSAPLIANKDPEDSLLVLGELIPELQEAAQALTHNTLQQVPLEQTVFNLLSKPELEALLKEAVNTGRETSRSALPVDKLLNVLSKKIATTLQEGVSNLKPKLRDIQKCECILPKGLIAYRVKHGDEIPFTLTYLSDGRVIIHPKNKDEEGEPALGYGANTNTYDAILLDPLNSSVHILVDRSTKNNNSTNPRESQEKVDALVKEIHTPLGGALSKGAKYVMGLPQLCYAYKGKDREDEYESERGYGAQKIFTLEEKGKDFLAFLPSVETPFNQQLRLPARTYLAEQNKRAYEILLGLSAIHEREILHRDIKPDNILLVNGHAKITDFDGLIKQNQAKGSPGGGTLGYTPQYAIDTNHSYASDLHATGQTLKSLFFGPALNEAEADKKELSACQNYNQKREAYYQKALKDTGHPLHQQAHFIEKMIQATATNKSKATKDACREYAQDFARAMNLNPTDF